MTDTPLEAVPDDLVRTAVLAAFNIPEDYARKHPGIVDSLIDTYGDQHRAALAAVLRLDLKAAKVLRSELDQWIAFHDDTQED